MRSNPRFTETRAGRVFCAGYALTLYTLSGALASAIPGAIDLQLGTMALVMLAVPSVCGVMLATVFAAIAIQRKG